MSTVASLHGEDTPMANTDTLPATATQPGHAPSNAVFEQSATPSRAQSHQPDISSAPEPRTASARSGSASLEAQPTEKLVQSTFSPAVSASISDSRQAGKGEIPSEPEVRVIAATPLTLSRDAIDGVHKPNGVDSPSVAFASPVNLGVHAKDQALRVNDVDALDRAFNASTKEAARTATKKNWRKALIGDARDESYMARAIIKHSQNRISILRDLVLAHGDQLLSTASSDFLDKAMRLRLATISAPDLITMLASSQRLGYEPEDLIDDEEIALAVPISVHAPAALTHNKPGDVVEISSASRIGYPQSGGQLPYHHTNAPHTAYTNSPYGRASADAINDARAVQLARIRDHGAARPSQAQEAIPQNVEGPGPLDHSIQSTTPKHQCQHCGKIFSQSGGLAYHVRERVCTKYQGQMNAGKFKAVCPRCNKGFTTTASFRTHQEHNICGRHDMPLVASPAASSSSMSTPPVQASGAQPRNILPHNPSPYQYAPATQPTAHAPLPSNGYPGPYQQPPGPPVQYPSPYNTPSNGIGESPRQQQPPASAFSAVNHSTVATQATRPMPAHRSSERRRSSELHQRTTADLPAGLSLKAAQASPRQQQPGAGSFPTPQAANSKQVSVLTAESLTPSQKPKPSIETPSSADGKVFPEDIDPQKRLAMEAELDAEAARLLGKIEELDKTDPDFDRISRQFQLTSATRKSQIRKNYGVRLRVRGPNKSTLDRKNQSSPGEKSVGALRSSFRPAMTSTPTPNMAPRPVSMGESPDAKRRRTAASNTESQSIYISGKSSPHDGTMIGVLNGPAPVASMTGTLVTGPTSKHADAQARWEAQEAIRQRARSHSPLEVVPPALTSSAFAPINKEAANGGASGSSIHAIAVDSSDDDSDGDIPARAPATVATIHSLQVPAMVSRARPYGII